jgi:phosphinothricin acetyltransferase
VHVLLAVLGGDNPESRALHLKFGFQQVGHLREVGFKFGQPVDTYYFQLVLDAPNDR